MKDYCGSECLICVNHKYPEFSQSHPDLKKGLTDYWTLVRVDAILNSLHLKPILISYYYFQVYVENIVEVITKK